MVTIAALEKMALSLPGTIQQPHFERTGFKVVGRRMFATLLPGASSANVFLTKEEQHLFCAMDPNNIYPVPNKWGEKGATTFNLNNLPPEIVMEALISAYKCIMSAKQKK